MSSMIERGREIIANGCDCDRDCFRVGAGHCSCKNDAIAFIRMMRDPTNSMLNEAAGAMSPGKRPTPDRVSCKEKHRIRYQAMIDCALASDTPAPQPETEKTDG